MIEFVGDMNFGSNYHPKVALFGTGGQEFNFGSFDSGENLAAGVLVNGEDCGTKKGVRGTLN